MILQKRMGFFLTAITLGLGIGLPGEMRAQKKGAPPKVELTVSGKKLEAEYAAQLDALKGEISAQLPNVSDAKKTSYVAGREAEKTATAKIAELEKTMAEIVKAEALVGHAKGKWIGGADKGIAGAQAKLKKASSDAERKAAEEELLKWQKNREDGVAALKERQANWDAWKPKKPGVQQELKDAREALVQAQAQTLKSVQEMGFESLLANNTLDAKLAKFSIMNEATPHGLAAFSQQGAEQQSLIDKMLSSDKLLVQIAAADGAREGNYGRAMQIYSDIWKASDKVRQPTLQRLALATALEHAVPIAQRNAVAKTDAPKTVDPVKRYLHFEKAFLNEELDPQFPNLSVWDYRMVVNGEEPDEILSWGREMLRNYRPDQVTKDDYRWRYVESVRSDIQYGSQDNKYDKDELQFFQNILMNGGICGRRAFFGRFILRSFGVPTTARPQKGHAALAHWTPEGWVVCLGAGWGSGWVYGRKSDLDFLAITQARATGEHFLQVKRAQWIGDVMGEPRAFGFNTDSPAFWNSVSLYTQQGLIEASNAKTLAAVGEDIGEANETKEKIEITKVKMTEADQKVTIDPAGVITIPASATSKPTQSNGKILFMESVLGGKQLHYGRNGGNQTFEYTFDAPAAGTYALTARVVTPSWRQRLTVTANGSGNPVDIALPHTVGMWDQTEPVEITLAEGKNVLRFSRNHESLKGISIKDFTLKPLK